MSEVFVSRLVPAPNPAPNFDIQIEKGTPAWEDLHGDYVLEGTSLTEALLSRGAESPGVALHLYAAPLKSKAVTHIRIADEAALSGCDKAFYSLCQTLNIRIIRFVDDQYFYDYVSRQYFILCYEYEWNALSSECDCMKWWQFSPIPFELGEKARIKNGSPAPWSAIAPPEAAKPAAAPAKAAGPDEKAAREAPAGKVSPMQDAPSKSSGPAWHALDEYRTPFDEELRWRRYRTDGLCDDSGISRWLYLDKPEEINAAVEEILVWAKTHCRISRRTIMIVLDNKDTFAALSEEAAQKCIDADISFCAIISDTALYDCIEQVNKTITFEYYPNYHDETHTHWSFEAQS